MDQLTVVNEQPLHKTLVFENNGEVLTDSLMIAEIFGKEHHNVLKDIKRIKESIEQLKNNVDVMESSIDMGVVRFYETYYTHPQNKQTYIKQLLNFDAFMLVTMSYTTQKAMLIKMKYINEFNRMKECIRKQQIPNDPMSILKLTFDALQGHEQEIQGIKTEVKDLQENTPLFAIECDEISNAVKRCGVTLLGGKSSNAYRDKSVRGKVYQDIYRQLRRQFDVKSHKAIKRRHLEVAKSIVADYELPIVLSEEIGFVNSQMNINEVQ
ncbi:ORF6C domain-containing protein [Bacillus mycoides]|uniref:ORF6C domain-containing protein n=1 Tax=Bacillus mycoides TaxID=1405 RepID=UPI003D65618F